MPVDAAKGKIKNYIMTDVKNPAYILITTDQGFKPKKQIKKIVNSYSSAKWVTKYTYNKKNQVIKTVETYNMSKQKQTIIYSYRNDGKIKETKSSFILKGSKPKKIIRKYDKKGQEEYFEMTSYIPGKEDNKETYIIKKDNKYSGNNIVSQTSYHDIKYTYEEEYADDYDGPRHVNTEKTCKTTYKYKNGLPVKCIGETSNSIPFWAAPGFFKYTNVCSYDSKGRVSKSGTAKIKYYTSGKEKGLVKYDGCYDYIYKFDKDGDIVTIVNKNPKTKEKVRVYQITYK